MPRKKETKSRIPKVVGGSRSLSGTPPIDKYSWYDLSAEPIAAFFSFEMELTRTEWRESAAGETVLEKSSG
jgi:hypothetical protein